MRAHSKPGALLRVGDLRKRSWRLVKPGQLETAPFRTSTRWGLLGPNIPNLPQNGDFSKLPGIRLFLLFLHFDFCQGSGSPDRKPDFPGPGGTAHFIVFRENIIGAHRVLVGPVGDQHSRLVYKPTPQRARDRVGTAVPPHQ